MHEVPIFFYNTPKRARRVLGPHFAQNPPGAQKGPRGGFCNKGRPRFLEAFLSAKKTNSGGTPKFNQALLREGGYPPPWGGNPPGGVILQKIGTSCIIVFLKKGTHPQN